MRPHAGRAAVAAVPGDRRRGRWATGGSRRWRGRRGCRRRRWPPGWRRPRIRGAWTALPPGRSRRPGAGRRKAEDAQPGLTAALDGAAGGRPRAAIRWRRSPGASLSLRDLERQLAALGFRCGKDAVARMLRADGYSLQGMSRVLEGKQHPDRDDQFRHINAMIAEFPAAGDPVVSVDAKKKEQLGPYHRAGRAWRPAGRPGAGPRPRLPRCGAGEDHPVRGLRHRREHRVRVRRHQPRHRRVRGERAAAVVAARGRAPLPRRAAAAGHLRRRRLQRLPGRLWKDQLAGLAAETGLEITRVPLPARHVASGTRSSTGCSATSPAPGGPGR